VTPGCRPLPCTADRGADINSPPVLLAVSAAPPARGPFSCQPLCADTEALIQPSKSRRKLNFLQALDETCTAEHGEGPYQNKRELFALADVERDLIRTRTAEGRSRAKAQGRPWVLIPGEVTREIRDDVTYQSDLMSLAIDFARRSGMMSPGQGGWSGAPAGS